MLEFADSFDSYSTAQLSRRYPGAVYGNTWILSPGADDTGSRLHMNNDGCGVNIPVTPRDEYYIGFDMKCSSPNGHDFLRFQTAAGGTICNFVNAGQLQTSFGSSAAGLIAAGTWYQFQFYLKRHASAGILTVKMDGVTVINLTGLNTGGTSIGQFSLQVNGNGNGGQPQYDNLWIFNTLGTHSNTWPVGRMKVKSILPSADGTYTAWTPNSGANHYDRVNQTTSDDDTTYISGLTPGDSDSFQMDNLTDPILKIHGIVLNVTHRKDDVDTKTLKTFVRSGSSNAESSNIDVPLVYTNSRIVVPEDPNGTIEWTESSVNALQAGVNVVA